MDRFKNSGKLVKNINTGKRGRTFNEKGLINGKVPVYYEKEKRFDFEETAKLCNIQDLEITGMID